MASKIALGQNASFFPLLEEGQLQKTAVPWCFCGKSLWSFAATEDFLGIMGGISMIFPRHKL
ncbi:hypothetical protein [Mariniradius sediminis]|uniref:hypothetical protein n=1 Tax=Mariniradius sediminis TaxID=2909237 RepID=UPI001F1E98F1|nr:hypothetical protein [Mariniradius sediminis]